MPATRPGSIPIFPASYARPGSRRPAEPYRFCGKPCSVEEEISNPGAAGTATSVAATRAVQGFPGEGGLWARQLRSGWKAKPKWTRSEAALNSAGNGGNGPASATARKADSS